MLQSKLELRLPYITSDLPGIGGSLRLTPEHFVVEEIPLYAASGEGQHLYVNLTKVGMTTKEVQQQLARTFQLKPGDVGFAGMKDKAARTTQSFSLAVGQRPPAFADEASQRIRDNLDVEVHWATFHRNKLRLGHLLGNRFAITISAPDVPVEVALGRATSIAEAVCRRGVPNYFGPQRLGRDGSNVVQGLEILAGTRRHGDRWLQRYLISAVQSYLCNRFLARRVERNAFDRLLAGDIAKKVATGGMFEVSDLEAEQPRYAAREISFTAPIYGPKMWAALDECGLWEQEVLAESGLTLDDFARVKVEGTRRLGRLLLDDLTVESGEAGIVARFALPKGAFATTVLREFMKGDEPQWAGVGDEDDE